MVFLKTRERRFYGTCLPVTDERRQLGIGELIVTFVIQPREPIRDPRRRRNVDQRARAGHVESGRQVRPGHSNLDVANRQWQYHHYTMS